MKLDKEATERMIKHALGSQIEQDRISRQNVLNVRFDSLADQDKL